jgi:hypothetical protein
MSADLIPNLIRSFLASSKSSIEALAKAVSSRGEIRRGAVTLYAFDGKAKKERTYEGSCFFLRTSMEYSSPQLTLEELEGLIVARLLEVCVNHRLDSTNIQPEDIEDMAEALRRPPVGRIVPFILETDDVEPDRYSNNPLRNSIVASGQSAFPVANVTTEGLKLDEHFVEKYMGSLISKDEVDLIEQNLGNIDRYVDFVDRVKQEELGRILQTLGLELRLPQLRMPLETLMNEETGGPFHSLVQASHKSYKAIEALYLLMGRSMKKKTLLPTVPHSPKGFGSKRSARGKLVFSNGTLAIIRVQYQTTSLYPNMADPNDLSFVRCKDDIELPASRLTDYQYKETPSSPQFALYALLSPEDGSIWHGVGEYEGNEILRSYASVRTAFMRNLIFEDVKSLRLRESAPVMFNLDPGKMWRHPTYGNIDAGIACLPDLSSLLSQEVKVTPVVTRLREPFAK